jgi:hypothetical protein
LYFTGGYTAAGRNTPSDGRGTPSRKGGRSVGFKDEHKTVFFGSGETSNTIDARGAVLEPSVKSRVQQKVGSPFNRGVRTGMSVYGARCSTEIYTRGCHWIPRIPLGRPLLLPVGTVNSV